MSNHERVARVYASLDTLSKAMEKEYETGHRILSFEEYLELFAKDPVRQGRDASRYVRDLFDYYGTREVTQPWGVLTRHRVFDLPWEPDLTQRRDALVGQEFVQEEIYRVLCNFAREGRANRFLLLHGPNGSAKSTVVACLMRALEHYSSVDEGALYRFHWVFPNQKTTRGSIGFGGDNRTPPGPVTSFAHLEESQIDARLVIEMRDHPLFLLPLAERRDLLKGLFEDAHASEPPADWLVRGRLAHKNQQVFEALLSTHHGNLREVLRYVQVERYFLSHRYRLGAVTIGPQMSVDAGERQITADRSLAALPTALQATTMFEAHGELIEAQGGILEFSDLLKRPIDTFKYLQISVETGEVALAQQNVQLNCVMMGSANEVHLDAFREHPEYPSFRGRFELVRVPYLLSYLEEQRIYEHQIVPQITKAVAPYVTRVAAMFAVLTRVRRPTPDRYSKVLAPLVTSLTAVEKMDLYSTATIPERFDGESAKLLRSHISEIYHESIVYPIYEGRVGVSPREMRTVLLNAAQNVSYDHLSPLAVIDEIEELCSRRNEFAWLQEKAQPGGYHDFQMMRETVRDRLFDSWEEDMRHASGLIKENTYAELFDRYVAHVSAWVKQEKLRNRITGDDEEPDVNMLSEVEGLLDVAIDGAETFRHTMISSIAAWAIDHPGKKVDPALVLPSYVKKMRANVFNERRPAVAKLCRDIVRHLRDGRGSGLDPARVAEVGAVLQRLSDNFSYGESAALDAASSLTRWRFTDVVV